jgi:hypothetical protein
MAYYVQGRLMKTRTKVKSMHIILFDVKRIEKNFVLAGQTVNLSYCCDLLR